MKGFSEIDHVGRGRHHMHWPRLHRESSHAVRLHPILWVEEHPTVLALLVAGAITLGIVALAKLVDTGISPQALDIQYPAAYPSGPVG